MRKTLISLAAVMATCAAPALAKDYILAPARPDKLIVVDTEKMAVEKVITVKDAGPTPMVPVVAPGGKIAYASVNKTESIVKLDLTTGETLAELARTLKAVGAVNVENRIVARTPAPG